MIYAFLSSLFAGKHPEVSLVFDLLSKSIYSTLITINLFLITVLLIRPFPWLRKFSYRKRVFTALVIAIASALMSTMLYISYLGIARFSQDIYDRCKVYDYIRDFSQPPLEDSGFRIVFTCDGDRQHEKSYLDGMHAIFHDMHYLNKQIARDCDLVKEPQFSDVPSPGEYYCGGDVFKRFPIDK